MSDETLKWKLFPFSLLRGAKCWYAHHIGNSQGDWEALRSSFRLQYFPIRRVVTLCLEILSFKQLENESLGKAWERFDMILNSGPNLALPEPMILQHFFMGLNNNTMQYLNSVMEGLFMHTIAEQARAILMNILDCLHEEEEKL
jgi:hypothetical protein